MSIIKLNSDYPSHNFISPGKERYKSLQTIFLNKQYMIAAVQLIAACIIAIGNVATLIAWHVPVPFSDEWDEFPRMIALHDADFPIGEVISYLWEQHNEHRIVVPKIIYLLDMTWFSYQGYFPIVCIFLFQTVIVGMLAWLLDGKRDNSWEILPLISLAVIAAFDLIQWENFASTFQTSFVGCFALSVAALVLYAKYTITDRRIYLVCTMLFAILASLSLASGLFIWIALALLAYLIHAQRYRQSFSFAGSFLIFLLLYLQDYTSPGQHAAPADSLMHHPLAVLNYLTVWLGNIAGTVPSARLLGSLALLVLLVLAAYLAKDKNRRRRVEIYTLLIICLFIVLTGFVTSLGRVSFGVDQAMSSRYTTPVLILWISLLGCLLLLALEFLKLSQAGGIDAGVMIGLIVAAFGVLVVRNYQGETAIISFQNSQVQAYLTVLTNRYKERPELLLPIVHRPSLILDKISLLKSHNLSSFNTSDASSFKLGGMLPPLTRQKTNTCKGHIDAVTAIGKETYQVAGWAWDEDLSSYPEWIFLVQDGNIIGLGKPGVQRPDVLAAIPSINKSRVGWQGIAWGLNSMRTDNIEAYISTGSGEYCRI